MKTKRKKGRSAGISDKVIRLLEVYKMIAMDHYPSARQIADMFQVSQRSAYRYLKIIGSIDPIENDREHGGYRFIGGDRFRKVSLGEDDLVTLRAVGEASSILGVDLAGRFRKVVQKVTTVAKEPHLPAGTIPIAVRGAEPAKIERFREHLDIASRAFEERRSLEIVYRSRGRKEALTRIVDPYGLAEHEGMWYLVGLCNLKKEIRTFAFDRILSCVPKQFFLFPKTFNLNDYLGQTWGIHFSRKARVTVRFSAAIADLIARKARWHPSEKRTTLPTGDLELVVTLAGIVEFKSWIYSWIPHVEIVSPRWLRKKMEEDMRKSLEHHRGCSTQRPAGKEEAVK